MKVSEHFGGSPWDWLQASPQFASAALLIATKRQEVASAQAVRDDPGAGPAPAGSDW